MNDKAILKLRKKHSEMDEDAAIAFQILAESNEYQRIYLNFVNLIKQIQNKIKPDLSLLNIGTGGGVLEEIILKENKKIIITSIDKYSSSRNLFIKKNQKFLKEGRLKYFITDITKNPILEGYDVVSLINVTHHVIQLELFINSCIKLLDTETLLYIEDLNPDANINTIRNNLDLVFNIEAFEKNKWLLYKKLIGFIESFAVAYKVEEIISILKKNGSKFKYKCADDKYYFIISKSDNYLKKLDI